MQRPSNSQRLLRSIFVFFSILVLGQTSSANPSYVVVVSEQTAQKAEWKAVVQTLRLKYGASVTKYESSIDAALTELQKQKPRYICVVAEPTNVTRQFVAEVHRTLRQIDDDPYTDAIWGILTGYNAQDALKVASHREPLTIRKVASGTEVALDACREGIWYCELKQGKMVRKLAGGIPSEAEGPADTTKALVDTLNDYQADLFVTSGHATERDWQIGYSYRNGSFRSKAGQLFGVDTKGSRFPISSPNPKVYMPIGNCLMGHIDGPDAMALAFMHSAGVYQMLGYTNVTWFGYGGWGCLDYFVEQPNRYTFAEAFHANHHALIHRLESIEPGLSRVELTDRGRPKQSTMPSGKPFPRDAIGLLFDRDIVAFYGDPAWEARMEAGPTAYSQELKQDGDQFQFTITPNIGQASFQPVNTNGAQRGFRPMVQFLPEPIDEAAMLEAGDLAPVITDDFILVPNPRKCDPERKYQVRFQANTRR